MSHWEILQKSAYLADFVELNKNLQKAVVKAITELEEDPVTPRGNTIKPLSGWEDLWRYRVGDFRIIYEVDHGSRMLRLLAVGPRASIYDRFHPDDWSPPGEPAEFSARPVQEKDWTEAWQAWSRPAPQKERLPRKLTPSLLKRWRVDPCYHPPLVRCLYAEDLVNAGEAGVPADVIGRVMEGLFPADATQIAKQPDRRLLDPADLLRYAEGDLSDFLLRLDEKQEPFTHWALAGPTLIKGGPGSGKSTVALYRVRALVKHALDERGEMPSILFATFTRALINSSRSLLQQLLRDELNLTPEEPLPKTIRVTTLHSTAKWIAHTTGKQFEMADDEQKEEALHLARQRLRAVGLGDQAQARHAAVVAGLRDEYLLEEFDWVVEGQNCRTLEEYLAAARVGRGIPFPVSWRTAVWELYRRFHEHLLSQNLYTWSYLLQVALDHVRAGGFRQRWQYVVVDEAQDLPPVGLALCVELCEEPSGLFLTADANQSLYNRGFRWRYVHEDMDITGRTRILRRNYRSTKEIAVAAAEILAAGEEPDAEALAQTCIHTGAYPVIYAADGSGQQAQWIARQIYNAAREDRLPPNAAAVLVNSSSVGEPLAAGLTAAGLPAVFMSSSEFDLQDPRVKVTTLHAAKGLEFPIVVVAHVEAGRLPRDTAATDPDELAAFRAEQRRLFYVGCTRAMRYLFVTYDRQVPSPFLTDLTDDCWMRLELEGQFAH